jgi:hypothetical protein
VYPVLDGGVVRVVAGTAASGPDSPDTASLGIVQVNTSEGEALLKCAADVGPGLTVAFSAVTVENPGGGESGIIKARAYLVAGCEGDLYSDSENTGYVRFVGPSSPTLLDPDSVPTPDVTIP